MNVYVLLEEERHGGVGPIGAFRTRAQVDEFMETFGKGYEKIDDNTFGSEESMIHVFELSVQED